MRSTEVANTSKLKTNLGDCALWVTNHLVAKIPSHRFRCGFYRAVMKYRIGPGSAIFLGAEFDARRNFQMGADSVVNQRCRLDTRGGIWIGNHVSISADVCILTADHDLESARFGGRTRPVVVEDYVFVGTRAMILPGVTLRRGCAVAAGSVVTRDVAAHTIVAGVPAKPIGERSTSLDYSLEYVRPWH